MHGNQYTWRTVQDSKVRSSHADREGKVFSWTDPPEGGHPGEAYNCRCWAENVESEKTDCEEVRLAMDNAYRRLNDLHFPILYAENDVKVSKDILDGLMAERSDVESQKRAAYLPTNLRNFTYVGLAATSALVLLLRQKLREIGQKIRETQQTLSEQEKKLGQLEHKRENLRRNAEEFSRRYQACQEENE